MALVVVSPGSSGIQVPVTSELVPRSPGCVPGGEEVRLSFERDFRSQNRSLRAVFESRGPWPWFTSAGDLDSCVLGVSIVMAGFRVVPSVSSEDGARRASLGTHWEEFCLGSLEAPLVMDSECSLVLERTDVDRETGFLS